MLKKSLAGAAGVAALVGGLLSTGATAASAATYAPPTVTYGFDGNAHLIVGGGSDTLYNMMLAIGNLWQEDNTVNNVTTGTNYGDQCQVVTSATQNSSGTYPASSSAPIANQYSNHQVNTPNASPSPTAPGLTNCNHDTVAEAYAAGSSTGIASLNGDSGSTAGTFPYEGTNSNIALNGTNYNGYGTPDFARSSRQPTTSGGNCPTSVSSSGNELACDTFWGIASDEVAVFSWNYGTAVNRGTELGDLGGGLTADDLYNIWNCNWTSWSQVPGLQAAVTAAGQTFVDGPIVPWGMNTASGTEKTFQSFIIHNASGNATSSGGVSGSWNIDSQGCDRKLSDGVVPFENDTKPPLTDAATNGYTVANSQYQSGVTDPWAGTFPAGITDDASSPQDPSNWIWWGSNGLMSAFPYLSAPQLTINTLANGTASPVQTTFAIGNAPIYYAGTSSGATTTAAPQAAPENCSGGPSAEPACETGSGILPSTSNVGQYPISRDLYLVTPKASADCPINSASPDFSGTYGNTCDLAGAAPSGEPGDIQVTGASSGLGGSVREFIRFVCRASTGQQQLDPYSSKNYFSEVGSAIAANGFAAVPIQSTVATTENKKPLLYGYQGQFQQAGLGASVGSACSVLSTANTTPAP